MLLPGHNGMDVTSRRVMHHEVSIVPIIVAVTTVTILNSLHRVSPLLILKQENSDTERHISKSPESVPTKILMTDSLIGISPGGFEMPRVSSVEASRP